MRNKFFDWHLLKEVEFNIPVIAVGNLAVGGTGKTPHVEYIVELMRRTRKVAVLSRGYKRETRGFVMAGATLCRVISAMNLTRFTVNSEVRLLWLYVRIGYTVSASCSG